MNRLVSCALIRDGEVHSRGFKEHWQIRAALGDVDPYKKNMNDDYGFLDSSGAFHDRWAAIPIAVAAGQLDKSWSRLPRELLSSDVRWDGGMATEVPRSTVNTKESRQSRRHRERKQR